jgi:hypothetical protein
MESMDVVRGGGGDTIPGVEYVGSQSSATLSNDLLK